MVAKPKRRSIGPDLATLDAVALRDRIAAGEVRAAELLEACLEGVDARAGIKVVELRAAGATPQRQEAGPAALTPREHEILTLVAQGRSNGEIARQLYISAKTVSVHVSNILAKLGASGRTEAAALARRRGLLD